MLFLCQNHTFSLLLDSLTANANSNPSTDPDILPSTSGTSSSTSLVTHASPKASQPNGNDFYICILQIKSLLQTPFSSSLMGLNINEPIRRKFLNDQKIMFLLEKMRTSYLGIISNDVLSYTTKNYLKQNYFLNWLVHKILLFNKYKAAIVHSKEKVSA